MVLGTALFRVRLVVQHELEVIVAFRRPHIDPAQHAWRAAASPKLAETQDAAVKAVRLLKVADENANMHNMVGNPRRGHEVPVLAGGPTIGLILDKDRKSVV